MHTKPYSERQRRRNKTLRRKARWELIGVLTFAVSLLLIIAVKVSIIAFVLYMAWLVVQHVIGA